MRRARAIVAPAAAIGIAIAGCGDSGGSEKPLPFPQSGEGAIGFEVPAALERGQQVAETQGCAACHRFGERGSDGPGGDLTDIGSRYAPEAIRNFLVAGSQQMPSYGGLPAADLKALVAFLSALEQPGSAQP